MPRVNTKVCISIVTIWLGMVYSISQSHHENGFVFEGFKETLWFAQCTPVNL